MKPIFPRMAVSILLILLLVACNLPQGGVTATDTGTVATKVVLTLTALTQSAQQTPLASLTLTASETFSQPTFTPSSTLTQTPALSPTPSITPIPKPGTIEGSISGYPYGSVPRLAIVAYGQEPPYNYSYWITGAGETYFAMSSSYLIPGHYQVVAYDSSGHAGGCTNNVQVISDQTVDCDITNWGGGYPAKPSGVPSP